VSRVAAAPPALPGCPRVHPRRSFDSPAASHTAAAWPPHASHRVAAPACLMALPAWPRLPAGAAVLPRRRYPRPTSQPAVHSYWRDFKCDRTRQAPRDFGRHAHSRSTEDSVLPNWTKACRDVRQSSTTVTDASGKLSCVLAHATRKAAVSWLWNMRSSLFVHTAARRRAEV
jgi:hypothetical protein